MGGRLAIIALMGWLMLAGGAQAAKPRPALGTVAFANSGAAAAQAPFLRGLALLHNFEYPDAATAFQEAQAADPSFAMAYWGEAMTYNHPVWMEQDAAKARAALQRLGATPAARAASARTAREAAYLHAVEMLYGEGSKFDRDFRYADEMAELHRLYPSDIDATAFYALSLLGTAHAGRDFAIYMRSAAILEGVFPDHRDHPGVLHYMIHSYDDPVHAPLGMRAARLYGALAPNAGHALHMTSHIFVAMGLWDEVIAANTQAMKVVAARQARVGPAGRPPPGCGHYPEWLVYGYLQEGKLADADHWIAACRAEALSQLPPTAQPALEPRRSFVASYTEMLARRAVDTGVWRGDAALPIAPGAHLGSRFNLAYGEAMATTDGAALAGLSARLGDIRRALAAAGPASSEEDPWSRIMAGQVAALADIANGKAEAGLAQLKDLAARESAAPIEFGPPAAFKPTLELLGDRLLGAGRPTEAAAAYRDALAHAPGRTRSLQGLLKTQRQMGDTAGAAVTAADLGRYPRLPAAP